ncbi:MAG: HPr family phosphocarrier protein [Oscillospiraceae bacterium]|nr:HPr family phosphocarrier protein [Oscillospiraceae bacterium]
MQQFLHPILEPRGIHLLCAGRIAKIAKLYADTAITVTRGRQGADAANLLSLLKLKVRQGDLVVVTADGPSENAAMTALQSYFEKHL